MSEKSGSIVPFLVAGALLALIAGAWWITRPGDSGPKAKGPSTPESNSAKSSTKSSKTTATEEKPADSGGDPRLVRKLYRSANPPQSIEEMNGIINGVLETLKNGSPEDKKAALDRLEEALWSAPPEIAIAAIRQFLKTGGDAQTGEGFVIGEKGILEESPTLRVFLMDQLGSLGLSSGDRSPVDVARDIMSSKQSADEWAVSLRNVAWFEPNTSQAYVGEKVREMLGHEPWLQQPSAGLLESFDGIVYAKDVSMVPKLNEFLLMNETTLQRATFVAMDRLSEASPLEVMQFMNANPQIFKEKPFLRADYYAAADLSVPAQRQAVEAYLSRQDVSKAEKTKFLGAITSPGSFISDNLFTESPKGATEQQETARANNLATIGQQWLNSGRFPDLQPELQQFIQANQSENP